MQVMKGSRWAEQSTRDQIRLFLVAWILFSLHFATNVVREHYPAFALIERGDWVCDAYVVEDPDGSVHALHSDLFPHTKEPYGDGHWYSGNNLLGSLVAAVPLFVFEPLLQRIEDWTRAKQTVPADDEGLARVQYETEHSVSGAAVDRMVRAGYHLRFGAATVVTSVFLMAPLSALWLAFMYRLLLRRGASRSQAVFLALAFGFATPILYRTAHLVHNMFLAQAAFACFYLVWRQDGEREPASVMRRCAAGFFGGSCFALDYAGVIPLLVFYAWLFFERIPRAGWLGAFRESLSFVAGSVPPVLFLLGSQWAMYGTPWYPGQFHMPDVNFTEHGWRGLTAPNLEVFWRNLVDLDWGLYPFGPILLLGLVPSALLGGRLLFPRRARALAALFVTAFMLFCSMNRYSLMQWNTGFRYLLPVVPFAFLAACDVLVRLPDRWRVGLVVASALQVVVLSMVRFTVPLIEDWRAGTTNAVSGSWERFFARGGVQFPWLTRVGGITPGEAWFEHPLAAWLLLAATLGLCLAIWRLFAPRGERAARKLLARRADVVGPDRASIAE